MTLTDAKDRFGMDDFDIRFLINSRLKMGEDYFMETVGHRRVLNFTIIGEDKLNSLIGNSGKDNPLC